MGTPTYLENLPTYVGNKMRLELKYILFKLAAVISVVVFGREAGCA